MRRLNTSRAIRRRLWRRRYKRITIGEYRQFQDMKQAWAKRDANAQASGENAEDNWAADAPPDVSGGFDPPPTSRADTEWEEDTQSGIGERGRAPRGRPFPKGMSGNPAGRPQGSRNRMNYMAEAMVEANLEGLMNTAIDLATGGNVAALRLLISKVLERPAEKAPHIPKSYDELANIYREMMHKSYDAEITMEQAKIEIKGLRILHDKLMERRPTFAPPKGSNETR